MKDKQYFCKVTERLHQSPLNEGVFGFLAAGAASAIIGNGDNEREAWDIELRCHVE
jgi:hypothetical protein